MTLLESFCPSLPQVLKHAFMLLLCSHNSYNTCNVTFAKKSSQNNALKKIAPPKKDAKKKLPPPTTIGREIFAPTPLVHLPPPHPPPGHK